MHYYSKSAQKLILAIFIASLSLAAVPALGVPSSRKLTLDHGARQPSVSPDGSQIAVSILGKIWLIPAQGGDARQITQGIGWDTNPAWSPDGRFLAYSHHLASGTDLVVLNLATGNTAFLSHTDALIAHIEYAPDARKLFFVLTGDAAHIQEISSEGGQAKPITETKDWHEWTFAVSPSGNEILTASGHHGGSNLYRISLDERIPMRVTRTKANQTQVTWTRDGKDFLYIEVLNGVETVFEQPVSGGARRALYTSPYRDTQIALDPHNNTAVLCAQRRLSRLNLATGTVTSIPFQASMELPPPPRGDLIIEHARLLDGTSDSAVENATIEIQNGRFQAIHSSNGFTAPRDVPVIDAAGRTVLPGLMDNHYHFWDPFDGPRLLARGITSIRDPGAPLSDSMDYKEATSLGLLSGPDIYSAGPLIDGIGGYHPLVDVEIEDPAKAAALVDSLKEQGVDFLKVYFMLEPSVLCSVIEEAHKVGLKVTGHLGVRTSWSKAVDCGIDGLNHVRVWADFLPLADQPQGENDSLDGDIHPVARMQENWSKIDPDGPAAQALIAKMASAGIGFDPTLIVQAVNDETRKELTLEEYALALDAYNRMGTFVVHLEQANILLLAGSDDRGLLGELESYERIGIPHSTIIRAATSNGAQWLGKQRDFGSIKPGRRADVVIIDGDPLKQIKDLQNVRTVIKDGTVVFEK